MPTDSQTNSSTCPHCSTELVANDDHSHSLWVRCTFCGKIFPRSKDDSQFRKLSRLSLWSLILGLFSIVLGLFSGIPAIYLGIKRLRLKTSPFRENRDYYLAILGIFSGGGFGLFTGCCVFSLVGLLLFVIATSNKTNDPDEVRQNLARIARVEMPESLHPTRSLSTFGVKLVKFTSFLEDQESPEPKVLQRETVEFEIGFYPIKSAVTEPQFFLKSTESVGLSGPLSESSKSEEKWNIAGQERKIILIECQDSEGKLYRKYFALFEYKKARYTLYLATLDKKKKPRQVSLTTEQVKRIFESFLPNI